MKSWHSLSRHFIAFVFLSVKRSASLIRLILLSLMYRLDIVIIFPLSCQADCRFTSVILWCQKWITSHIYRRSWPKGIGHEDQEWKGAPSPRERNRPTRGLGNERNLSRSATNVGCPAGHSRLFASATLGGQKHLST